MNFKQLFLFEILKFTWKANKNELLNFFNSIFPHLTINDNTRISTRNKDLLKTIFLLVEPVINLVLLEASVHHRGLNCLKNLSL